MVLPLFSATFGAENMGYLVSMGIAQELFVALIFIFIYSYVTVSTINNDFSSERHTFQVEIVDKKFHTSPRGLDHHSLYVILSDKKICINVPKTTYRNKEIGQMLTIYYYEGFLSVPYIRSAE